MAASFSANGPGSRREDEPQEFTDLACKDDDGDAGGKADGDRIGNELDVVTEPEEAAGYQNHTGHGGCQKQTVDAVPRHRGAHENDEGAGRPADLMTAATEQRHEEATDDRGIETRSGVTPEAIAIAIDSGRATIATVRPASASALRRARP